MLPLTDPRRGSLRTRMYSPSSSVKKGGLGVVLACCFLTGCTTLSDKIGGSYKTIVDEEIGNEAEAAKLETRAVHQMEKGHYDKAQELLQQSLEADVNFGPAHNTLGKLYYDQHKLYLAAWEYQYAAKLMPGRHEPYNNLGLTFERAGRFDEAIEWYSTALEMAPQSVDVMGNLARVKVKRGDRDETLTHLLNELILRDDRRAWLSWAERQLLRLRAQATCTTECIVEDELVVPTIDQPEPSSSQWSSAASPSLPLP